MGLELTKLTYTRLEDNLIRHRGDRIYTLSSCLLKSILGTNCLELVGDTFVSNRRLKACLRIFMKARAYLVKALKAVKA